MFQSDMENTFNGKNRSSIQTRQQEQKYSQPNGYSNFSVHSGGGAIMESLDPSLVGNDIEQEIASAGILNVNPKNKPNPDIRNFPYCERSNMSSSTNSYGSSGKQFGFDFVLIYIVL